MLKGQEGLSQGGLEFPNPTDRGIAATDPTTSGGIWLYTSYMVVYVRIFTHLCHLIIPEFSPLHKYTHLNFLDICPGCVEYFNAFRVLVSSISGSEWVWSPNAEVVLDTTHRKVNNQQPSLATATVSNREISC